MSPRPGAKQDSRTPGSNPPGRGGAADPYTPGFREDEISDLEALLDSGLSSEIAMLRASTRRLFAISKESEGLEAAVKSLRVLGLSATRLANLLKTQAELDAGKGDHFAQVLNEALEEVAQELRLKL
ncbi:MAG: hypothetical protein ACK2TW_02405 [Anaerolineales bacterium]